MINFLEEIETDNEEVIDIDKLAEKFSLRLSPLVEIMHDRKLTKQQKLLLIAKLAQEKPNFLQKPYFFLPPLFHAVVSDDIDFVALLLEKGADIHQTIEKSNLVYLHRIFGEGISKGSFNSVEYFEKNISSLHLAAECANAEILELLLQKGAKVDAQGASGLTPLHLATTVECAEKLLAYGADPHATDENGDTPLHTVCLQRQEESSAERQTKKIILALLKAGASINHKNKFGYTPLHYAVKIFKEIDRPSDFRTMEEAIFTLCENGADVNAITADIDNDLEPMSPLLYFFNNDKNELFSPKKMSIAKLLLQYKADITLAYKNGRTILDEVISCFNFPEFRVSWSEKELEVFLTLPGAKQLLDYQPSKSQPTTLHKAVHKYISLEHYCRLRLGIIRILLENGANPLAVFYDGEKPVTPHEYGLSLNYEMVHKTKPLELIKKWEEIAPLRNELKNYNEKFQKIKDNIENPIPQQNITDQEKITQEINKELEKLITDLEKLSQKFPEARECLITVKFYVAETMMQQMESLPDLKEIFTVLEGIRKLLTKSDNSYISKCKDIIYELGNRCCLLDVTQKPNQKDNYIAAAIACWLFSNREFATNIDYKGLFIELMHLKLDKNNLSMDELKNQHPEEYRIAWNKINNNLFNLAQGGDTFSNKKFVIKTEKNLSVINRGNKKFLLWQKSLPTAQTPAQDDCQRTKKYQQQPARRSSFSS